MSSGTFKRATKNHAVRVNYTDGSASEGFVPVPFGMDFQSVLMQAQGFIQFETSEGEQTFLNLSAIKTITNTQVEGASEEETQRAAARAQKAREKEAENEWAAQEAAAKREAEEKQKRASKRNWSAEEYDALEILGLQADTDRGHVQSSYRKLVKLYHPDRLSGMGVSPKKIEFAAQKLAEINSAYHILMGSEILAA